MSFEWVWLMSNQTHGNQDFKICFLSTLLPIARTHARTHAHTHTQTHHTDTLKHTLELEHVSSTTVTSVLSRLTW